MTDLVDYAMPLMIIEKTAKKVHDLCLDKKFYDATIELSELDFQAAILRKNLIAMQIEENKRT